jgi:hypothetical protein
LHGGEFVRDVQTDEVFDGSISGKAAAQGSQLLVSHDEDEVGPLEHPAQEDAFRWRRTHHEDRLILADA